jgi:glycolate oxidase iron-sulfur subunit
MTAPTPPCEGAAKLDADLLKACIHCGMCLPACPTYRVTGSEAESPRGRLYLMRGWLEGEITDPEQIRPHIDQCLGCQACQTACPSGVQYGSLLFQTREALAPHQPKLKRWVKRFVFRSVLTNQNLLQTLGGFLRVYQQSGLQQLVRGLGLLKAVPALADQEALLPQLPARRALHAGMSFGNMDNPRVALVTGCVMDVFYNPVHWATIQVLVANGYYVTVPEQTCCGALAHHAGESDIAQTQARQNLTALMKGDPDWVVINSAGCGATLKEYHHLLADDPVYRKRAQEFAAKVVDVMELLAKKPLAPIKGRLEQTVTYHAACHLRHAQGITDIPTQLLAQIPGLTLVPLKDAEACCGSAGIYNIEQPQLSQEILAQKMGHLKATDAAVVVTGNPGCLLQLEAGVRQTGLKMQVKHPIELLAEAYAAAPAESPR